MEQKILVAYTTNAGSTAEVADSVAAQLRSETVGVDVRRLGEASDLSGYHAVVLGAPMILGWHREALKFLRQHQHELSRIPCAFFITAMSLTDTGESDLDGIPLTIDPNLARPPKFPGRLSLREAYATTGRYLKPILRAAPAVRPLSIGLFAGKLDYSLLKPLQLLFVMLVIQARPGDQRSWPLIKSWAAGLAPLLAADK